MFSLNMFSLKSIPPPSSLSLSRPSLSLSLSSACGFPTPYLALLQDWNLRSLHQHMGLVAQDTQLFSGTILDNITYGLEQGNPQPSTLNLQGRESEGCFFVRWGRPLTCLRMPGARHLHAEGCGGGCARSQCPRIHSRATRGQPNRPMSDPCPKTPRTRCQPCARISTPTPTAMNIRRNSKHDLLVCSAMSLAGFPHACGGARLTHERRTEAADIHCAVRLARGRANLKVRDGTSVVWCCGACGMV
jgi:hypothetical protein